MDLKIGCSCGQHLLLPAEAAGRQVKCPACGAELIVPGLPTALSAKATAPVSEIAEPGPPAGGRRKGLVVALVSAAVIIAAGIGMALWNAKTREHGGVGAEAGIQPTAERPSTPQAGAPSETAAKDNQNRSGDPRPLTGPRKVTIDRERRCVLVDGQPFFAIVGSMMDEGHFKEAKEMGFNCANRFGTQWSVWSNRQARMPQEIRQYLDAAQEAGLLVIDCPDSLGEGDPDANEPKPFPKWRSFLKTKLPGIVDTIKDHPALIGYYGPDEPNLWMNMGATEQQSHELLLQYYGIIRRHDPNHLIHFGFGGQMVMENWGDSFDTASASKSQWYSLPLGLSVTGGPRKVFCAAQSESAKCERLGKPFWNCCQLDALYGHNPFNSRLTGPQDQRMQAYLGIIGGAKGLWYWHWPPTTEAASSGFKTLFGEIREIAPALMERTPKFSVQYAPDNLKAALPLLIRNYESKSYLIVANCGRFPIEARFGLPQAMGASGGEAEVLFANRRLKIENGKLGERLDAFETRVYRFARPWPDGGRLEVALTPQAAVDTGPAANLKRMLSAGGANLAGNLQFGNARGWQPRIEKEAERDTGAKGEVIRDARMSENALHLRTSQQQKRNICFESQSPIPLQARSRYLFAVRGRVWTDTIVTARVGLRPATNPDQVASGWFSFTSGAWLDLPELGLQPETIGMTFVTGPQPFSVRPLCRLVNGPGEAWFHEIIVKKLPNSKNILRNSGFEQEGAPGEALYWGLIFHPSPVVAGDPDPCVTLDRKEKYEGAASLRLSHPRTSNPEFIKGDAVDLMQTINYGFQKGDELTLSFHAKANKSGVNLVPSLEKAGKKIFPLTPEWQKYTLALKCTDKDDKKVIHFSVGGATPGKVWIDAVQLEPGTQATAYEEGGW